MLPPHQLSKQKENNKIKHSTNNVFAKYARESWIAYKYALKILYTASNSCTPHFDIFEFFKWKLGVKAVWIGGFIVAAVMNETSVTVVALA